MNTSTISTTPCTGGTIREAESDCRLFLGRLTDAQLEDAKTLLFYCFTLSDQRRREGVEAFFRLSMKDREGGGQA